MRSLKLLIGLLKHDVLGDPVQHVPAVADVQTRVVRLAEAADLSQKSLYKILSDAKDAKPRYETIVKLLNALGLRLTVEERPHAS